MLAFLDYPEWRRSIEDYTTLDDLLMRNMKQALSLIVMIGGGYDESINSVFLRVWNGLTGNEGFIEDVHALAIQYRKKLINEVDLAGSLIDLLNRRNFSLVDLIMMNNYLKLINDINVLDLGLAIFYENPESILMGVREPPDLVPNKLVSKELTIDLEAKCMVVKRTFSVHLSRQYESSVYVVDWSNPGLIPYSKFVMPRIEGIEVSDPVFSALTRFKVRAVSRVVGKDFILTLPKSMDVKTDTNYCVSNVFISLPQSMGLSDYLSLVGKLMGMGYNVHKSPFVRIDELLEYCLLSRGQKVK